MNGQTDITIHALLTASCLVFISLLFSYSQRLKIEKETLISVLRAIVQLIIVGYILNIIFGLKSPVFTTILLMVITFNASYNAAKRGNKIRNGLAISFVSIAGGGFITLTILVLSGAIHYEAYQVIPVGGMIVSNAMIALGLCYRQLTADFINKRDQIETKLALGADIHLSSMEIIRDAIRTAMMPTIDSAKTLGIVALPGMMTGLILAGVSPLAAIKYQIMVTFMMLSTTAISSFTACYLAYRGFFNSRKQLI